MEDYPYNLIQEAPDRIPCSNPNCKNGWDEKARDVCKDCSGKGYNVPDENKEIPF